MAGLMVAGSFPSAALNVLFVRMASKQAIDFLRSKKLDENLLRNLGIWLSSTERVLNDAEKKQLTDPAVRKWLHQLRDAIYDAEDLVYEINTEAERSELESGRSGSRSLCQVPNFLSSSRFTVPEIEQRIEEIHSMLKSIIDEKDVLGLREGALETRPFPILSEAPLVDDSDIYGRDADKEAILKLLLSEEVGGGDNKVVSVIPIVGMGGIGKTTLARLVYKDIDRHVIDKPFDLKAWITVSEESNVFTLTKTIYEAVTKNEPDSSKKQLFQLQRQLKELLENKKFLFVFDDVWDLNYQRWSDLKVPLQSAAHGSKIIVTTRSTEIASVMGSVSGHELQTLSEENSWRLFAKHVFNNGEPSGQLPYLEAIGRQIVQKCQGLPLAIKSFSFLLHLERNPKEWENVLKKDIRDLPERENGILPALWLSYHYLPPHLKQCFAYCSLFPKDYRIPEEKLILLWMAEDFLQPQKNKTLEEVGMDYLKDLTSRSFFHRNHHGEVSMHHLVTDLANFVSREFCLTLNERYSVGLPRKTRYLSIMGYKIHDMKKLEEISQYKLLRTLLVLDGGSDTLIEHYNKYPEQLQSMRYLRVFSASFFMTRYLPYSTKLLDSIGGLKLLRYLDLSCSGIKEVPDVICTLYNLQTLLFRVCWELIALPDSIGNLKHLSYLDLSGTPIEKLPDTICNLHELHTLDLSYCKNLSRLPTTISTLINLRHLLICSTSIVMPLQLSNLTNLESLEEFVVDKNGGGSNIRALGKLQYLCGRLCIRRLENVENVGHVLEANLKDKMGITELALVWDDESDDLHKPRETLIRLRPHTNLKSLRIENYGSTNFPDWVGHHSFSCITSVNLIGCQNCYLLPPLGQLPSLEEFEISGFDMVERIGEEFYYNGSSSATKPFKSLKRMRFSDMPRWKEWSRWGSDDEEGGVFSKVEYLELSNCEMINVARLPDNLPSLKRLMIGGRNQLV